MENLKFLLYPCLLIISAIILTSCSDSNPLSSNIEEELDNPANTANNSVTLSMLAPVESNTTSKTKDGTSTTLTVDDITISEVKMLVRELELESTQDDSLNFQANNLIVDLPLDGSPFLISTQPVPVGIYDELEVDVDKPEADVDVGDIDFNDGENRYAIVIRGTKDGSDFTLKSQEDFDFELEFQPPIEITDSTSEVEIDVMVNVEKWFRTGLNGRTLDPSDPDDIERIEENIERSFEIRSRLRNRDNRDDREDRRDRTKEFKQPVKSVDLDSNTFTIANGLTIQVTDSTIIGQGGDLLSLEQVQRALNRNTPVKAEGRVARADEDTRADFIAIRVKFETKGNDDSDEDDNFEQVVQSVNLEQSTFTTRNGFIVKVTDRTRIKQDGDLILLREVHNALQQNVIVEVEGRVRRAVSEPDIDFIAVRIKFEVDRDEDEDGEADNEFERKVESVNLEARTFTTRGGIVVKVTENTTITRAGDLRTLRAVKNALDNDQVVEVEGRLRRAVNDPDVDFIAVRLKFETEDDDDDEFERTIRSVDLQNNRFTTTVGSIVQLNENTVISRVGDLMNLREVSDALSENKEVKVEGRVRAAAGNPDADFIAERLKFETDNDEDNEDEDEDDNEDED